MKILLFFLVGLSYQKLIGYPLCSDGYFFAVKEVSLLDQGSQGKQSVYQLEQVKEASVSPWCFLIYYAYTLLFGMLNSVCM